MQSSPSFETGPVDAIVAGLGASGLTAAIALARAGLRVAAAGELDTRPTGRTVALLDGSVAFLRSLGLWESIAPEAAPLAAIRIIDATGSLFRPPPAVFRAEEIDLQAFGFNIENDALVRILAAAARRTPGLSLVEGRIEGFDFGARSAVLRLGGGRSLAAPLIIAADGRRSQARIAGGIRVRERGHGQAALTAILAHRLPHRDISTEFHTRAGPFTLVPLAGTADAAHRSSLVWMLPRGRAHRLSKLADAALAAEIERQAQSFLGAMRLDGPRSVFPIVSMKADRLTAPRLALVGDAAHVLPPIGAQGLNLGLRDVVDLVRCLADARSRRLDLADPRVLAHYGRLRSGDVMMRDVAVSTLNQLLLMDFPPADLLRGTGLLALATIGPLRRAVMREGVEPRRNGAFLPRLASRPMTCRLA